MERYEPGGDLSPGDALRTMIHCDDLLGLVSPEGIITWMNGSTGILGYRPEELIGIQCLDLIHPDQAERALEAFAVQAEAGGYELITATMFRIRTGDGSYRECDVSAWPIVSDGVVEHLAIHVRPSLDARLLWSLLNDLLAGVEPPEALEQMLSLVFERGDFSRCTVELDHQAGSRLVGSKLNGLVVGHAPDGSVPEPWATVRATGRAVRVDNRDDLPADVAAAAAAEGLQAVWAAPVLGEDAVEGLVTMWIVEDGPPIAVNAYLIDILQPLASLVVRWQRQQQRLDDAAHVDALTGCANRRMILAELEQMLAHPGPTPPAILYVDLDRFKAVNDLHGHAVGDGVLVETVRRLESLFDGTELVGRLGGDEFVVLIVDPADDLEAVAEQLVAALSETMVIDGIPVRIGASVGLVRCRSGETADEVLSRADDALYGSKRLGRGVVTTAAEPIAEPEHSDRRRTSTDQSDRAVRDRLVETAADLLPRVGPRAITAAVVAQLAGVRRDDVSAHFGSMYELQSAGMELIARRHFEQARSAARGGDVSSGPLRRDSDYWKALIRCALDDEIGLSAAEVDADVSMPRWLLRTVEPGRRSEMRVRLAALMALEFGWLALDPTIRAVIGVEPGEDVEAMVQSIRSELLGPLVADDDDPTD